MRGFTLIELLVVIAIIAILAAILFPVFAKAREKARQTSCASNEKRLGLAFVQYSQDYDEYYPCGVVASGGQEWTLGVGWAGEIYPYVKSTGVFTCPDDYFPATPTEISYAYNNDMVAGPANDFADLSKMANASKLASPAVTVRPYTNVGDVYSNITQGIETGPSYYSALGHGIYLRVTARREPAPWYPIPVPRGRSDGESDGLRRRSIREFATGRHTDASNVLFFDGHVKWMRGTTLSPGYNAATSATPLGSVATNATGTGVSVATFSIT